ncbi:hypothetical protein J0910_00480 [Nocardiopsis sp. CNT-189]|uniref:hypothetical protein n=1 Tax=Nocardiopsis oceanisediminis TaxID=2816862 RepID=UPI003B2E7A42
MTAREQAHRDGVALIARRLVERDEQATDDRPDPEVWAAAVLTELAGFGWRPTAARTTTWQPRPGHQPADPQTARAYAAGIRARLRPSGHDNEES